MYSMNYSLTLKIQMIITNNTSMDIKDNKENLGE